MLWGVFVGNLLHGDIVVGMVFEEGIRFPVDEAFFLFVAEIPSQEQGWYPHVPEPAGQRGKLPLGGQQHNCVYLSVAGKTRGVTNHVHVGSVACVAHILQVVYLESRMVKFPLEIHHALLSHTVSIGGLVGVVIVAFHDGVFLGWVKKPYGLLPRPVPQAYEVDGRMEGVVVVVIVVHLFQGEAVDVEIDMEWFF